MDNKYDFKLDFKVRDYECDFQGIVNNAVYQNYLEHTRSEFLRSNGLSVTELSKKNINLIVIKIEINYKYPLRAGDHFYVTLKMDKISWLKFGFFQEIYRYPDEKLILNAHVIGTSINENGRPVKIHNVSDIFA